MKFLFYNVTTTIKVGGIETYNIQMAYALQKVGHEVMLFSGVGSHNKLKDLDIREFKFINRRYFRFFGNRFSKFMERFSFFIFCFNVLLKENIDFLVLSKPFDFFVVYFLKLKKPHIKAIFVSGGEDFYFFDRFFAKRLDVIIGVSKAIVEILEKRYKKKVYLIPNGVNLEVFKKIELQKEQNSLVSVGRVVGWKGFDLVIKALNSLPNFSYKIVGDGPYLETLKKMAKEMGLEDRVYFLGEKNQEEIAELLNKSNVFILPSIGLEAFGIVILEAMACGLPVVASRNGGIVDIIEDGVNGYLFEIGDINGLILAIKRAMLDEKRVSETGFRMVKEKYSWDVAAKKLIEILL